MPQPVGKEPMSLLLLGLCFATAATGLSVTANEFAANTYDYIVAGGGTAGAVVAARLSEIPSVRVGLIEAGEYLPDDPNINIPQGSGYLGNPTYDWMLQSVPQENVNGRQIFLPRGKILGGSSAINAMIWQYPPKDEIDMWDTVFGNGAEWTFDALQPYFRKCCSWTPPTLLYPGQRQSNRLAAAQGFDGPLNISYNVFETDVDTPVVVAGHNLGVYINSNLASGNATGFGQIARTVNPDTGTRSYSANAYYTPSEHRENFHLLTGAHVSKIIFDSNKVATAVEYNVAGKKYQSAVAKEVILSAGSLKSPQILELSGVGNKTLLEELGIPVVLDLPEVGENLQDHPVSMVDASTKPGVITLDELRINPKYRQEQLEIYLASREGAFSKTAGVLGPTPLQVFVPPERLDAMLADLKKTLDSMDLTPLQRRSYQTQYDVVRAGKLGWVEFTMVPSGNLASVAETDKSYLTVVAIQLHNFNRGSVHINSTDPLKQPLIDPHFLEFPFDADVLAEGTKFLQRWLKTAPLSDLVAEFNTPTKEFEDDNAALEHVRRYMQTTNHPTGTTVMAERALGGVVDRNLKVYGLENVRVVDAGIIPQTLGVAVLSIVYALAEKAADIIKEGIDIPTNNASFVVQGTGTAWGEYFYP